MRSDDIYKRLLRQPKRLSPEGELKDSGVFILTNTMYFKLEWFDPRLGRSGNYRNVGGEQQTSNSHQSVSLKFTHLCGIVHLK